MKNMGRFSDNISKRWKSDGAQMRQKGLALTLPSWSEYILSTVYRSWTKCIKDTNHQLVNPRRELEAWTSKSSKMSLHC